MRFDSRLMETLKPKFDRAFKDMEALEKGAIANPDENRMVGHYWLRDPDLAPTEALKQEIIQPLEQIEAFVQKVYPRECLYRRNRQFHAVISFVLSPVHDRLASGTFGATA